VVRWKALAKPDYRPKPGALITVGFDGALFFDSTAITATEVETGFQWKAGLWEKPATWPKDKLWKVDAGDVDRVMHDLFDTYEVPLRATAPRRSLKMSCQNSTKLLSESYTYCR
jgi:hypothetical protein